MLQNLKSSKNDKKNDKKPNQGMLTAFLPGQKEALAEQLQTGFGGTPEQWNGMLSAAYSRPVNSIGFNYGGNGGGGNGNGGVNPQGAPGTPGTPVVTTPTSPFGSNNMLTAQQFSNHPEMLIKLRRMGIV